MLRKPKALKVTGFTLIELMIVIVIIAIMISFAGPGLRNMVLQNRATGISEELVSALALARLEAVTRKANVSLCRSSDGSGCSGSGNWADGYILYVDNSAETADTTTVDGDPIRVFSDIHRTANIALKRNNTDVGFIRFTRLGTVARIENFDSVFTINVDGCAGIDAQRQVTVLLSGVASSIRQSCPGE